MLRRIVQICVFILGGTLGIFLIPDLLKLVKFDHLNFINNAYVSAVLGGIIFYLIFFWAIDYIVNAVKWLEDRIVKAPITDILFGSMGLAFGLLIAFLAGLTINQMAIPILDTFIPILLTLLLGYLGFQVGFKKRDELTSLFFY